MQEEDPLMRSVDEKYKYNMKRLKEPFARGYCMGVALYQGYPKANAADKKKRQDAVDAAKLGAQNGDVYHKGIMCGIRDAANERKSRRGK